MTEFSVWLNQKLIAKNWNQANLSTVANIDSGFVSRMLSGERVPGYKTCQKLARALGVPEDEVLYAAGKKSTKPNRDETSETINYQLSHLPRQIREQVAEFVNYLYERHAQPAASETPQPDR